MNSKAFKLAIVTIVLCAAFVVVYGLLLDATRQLPEWGSTERTANKIQVRIFVVALIGIVVVGYISFSRLLGIFLYDKEKVDLTAEQLKIDFPLFIVDNKTDTPIAESFATLEAVGNRLKWMNAGPPFFRDQEKQYRVQDAKHRPLWLLIEDGYVKSVRWRC